MGVPRVRPSTDTPERISTLSASFRGVVRRDWPGLEGGREGGREGGGRESGREGGRAGGRAGGRGGGEVGWRSVSFCCCNTTDE